MPCAAVFGAQMSEAKAAVANAIDRALFGLRASIFGNETRLTGVLINGPEACEYHFEANGLRFASIDGKHDPKLNPEVDSDNHPMTIVKDRSGGTQCGRLLRRGETIAELAVAGDKHLRCPFDTIETKRFTRFSFKMAPKQQLPVQLLFNGGLNATVATDVVACKKDGFWVVQQTISIKNGLPFTAKVVDLAICWNPQSRYVEWNPQDGSGGYYPAMAAASCGGAAGAASIDDISEQVADSAADIAGPLSLGPVDLPAEGKTRQRTPRDPVQLDTIAVTDVISFWNAEHPPSISTIYALQPSDSLLPSRVDLVTTKGLPFGSIQLPLWNRNMAPIEVTIGCRNILTVKDFVIERKPEKEEKDPKQADPKASTDPKAASDAAAKPMDVDATGDDKKGGGDGPAAKKRKTPEDDSVPLPRYRLTIKSHSKGKASTNFRITGRAIGGQSDEGTINPGEERTFVFHLKNDPHKSS